MKTLYRFSHVADSVCDRYSVNRFICKGNPLSIGLHDLKAVMKEISFLLSHSEHLRAKIEKNCFCLRIILQKTKSDFTCAGTQIKKIFRVSHRLDELSIPFFMASKSKRCICTIIIFGSAGKHCLY